MTTIQGAVLKEQGYLFAIVIVQPHILDFRDDREAMLAQLKPLFPGMTVVLMAQDGLARPRWFGPEPIVAILQGVRPEQIAWKEYTFKD